MRCNTRKYELDFERNDIPKKDKYTQEEVEQLRQTNWEAHVNLNNTDFHIVCTSIPGFRWSFLGENGYEEFKRDKRLASNTKITINGVEY